MPNAPPPSSPGCCETSPALLSEAPPHYNPSMHEVVVYSRNGCHLCDVVKQTLAQLQPSTDFRWRAIDIDGDP